VTGLCQPKVAEQFSAARENDGSIESLADVADGGWYVLPLLQAMHRANIQVAIG